ncbi:MAG: DUF885 domain-containing protein [Leptothrix sp. (in: Bacteria)]|nr:DUF885 domain-containing protein [Leptothrix sp. (in: b-proteobacteria)]
MTSDDSRAGLRGPHASGRWPALRRACAAAGLALSLAPLGHAADAQAVVAAATPAAAPASTFDDWSERLAADWVRQSAEMATRTQYFSGDGQAALERQLTPQTPERRQRQQALAREGLAQLGRFEGGTLTPAQRTGARLLRWSLQRTLDDEPFVDHYFAFSQTGGVHVRLVSFLTEGHPLRSAADVAAYLERLTQVDQRLDEALARARAAADRGLLPPRFIVERALGQVRALQAAPGSRSEFVAALARRSERITGLGAAERQKALAAAEATVTQRVLPAYARVAAFLESLLPRTGLDAGFWRLPAGPAAYAQALAAHTTTSMGADEIHALGLREVARIEGDMDRVLKGLGRSEGTVRERMLALRNELMPPAEPDPRPALLARYAAAVRDAERRAQALFNLQPRAPVEVRRVPALTERTSSAYYTTPAPDGSQPGVFWMPLPGPTFNVLGLRSLAVHEAVPGHHFQLALQQETASLPRWRQRRIFGGGSAHSEGWALYAERLAIDEGWYEGDPHSLLGALDSQLLRARRLVVDTGLHALRWTREQAIAYGIGAQEVERYIVNPGQACAYMVGMLRILALRDEARQALGPRFDLKAFHDLVLQTGSVPLDVLADVVREWVKAQPAA